MNRWGRLRARWTPWNTLATTPPTRPPPSRRAAHCRGRLSPAEKVAAGRRLLWQGASFARLPTSSHPLCSLDCLASHSARLRLFPWTCGTDGHALGAQATAHSATSEPASSRQSCILSTGPGPGPTPHPRDQKVARSKPRLPSAPGALLQNRCRHGATKSQTKRRWCRAASSLLLLRAPTTWCDVLQKPKLPPRHRPSLSLHVRLPLQALQRPRPSPPPPNPPVVQEHRRRERGRRFLWAPLRPSGARP
mmetsp:Transcript_22971/g.53646  ORF Transcript_22971/g.53646 Transcript_22971/m.53646 type:complete len:249 (+) Transcript_22971:1444-2190(+)